MPTQQKNYEFRSLDDFKEQCGYTIDNEWLPRVTKIVSIKAKPALYRYYGAAKSFDAAQSATEQSAKEGTMVHEAIEAHLLGKTTEIDPLIVPSVQSFIKFVDEQHIHVLPDRIERRIVSKDH